MKTSLVSNLSIQNAMRLTMQQAQAELVRSQEEVVTGRYADVGVALGYTTSRTINLHRDVQRMETLVDTNSIVTQRLSGSQEALNLMAEGAQTALESLIALSGSATADELDTAKRSIKDSMGIFTSAANTSFSGEFLFSGTNTDVRPMADYFAPGSPAKTSFDADFLAFFGFTQSDPQTATITSTDMQTFITGLEASYLGTGWTDDWSSTSGQNMTSRISTTEVVQSSTNTNAEGMRKYALASVIAYEMLGMSVSSEVRTLVSESTIKYMGEAINGIDAERSQLGISEARVKKANTSLEAQIKIIKLNIRDLEGVDPYEATTRMNTIEAQVEASYTMTARLQSLSLVNFL